MVDQNTESLPSDPANLQVRTPEGDEPAVLREIRRFNAFRFLGDRWVDQHEGVAALAMARALKRFPTTVYRVAPYRALLLDFRRANGASFRRTA